MKKAISLVVVILLIGGIYLFTHLGGAVKIAIEKTGTQTLGTKVTVNAVDLSLAEKKAAIDGLSIANPAGFKMPDIFKMKVAAIALGDVSRKLVVIKNITVDGLGATYELGPRGSNFDILRKKLNASAAASENRGSGKENGKSGARIVIERLHIIHASVTTAVAGQSKTIPLPEIIMTNIGSKSSPATAAEVTRDIISRVLAVSSATAVKSGLAASVKGAVQKAEGALKGLFSK